MLFEGARTTKALMLGLLVIVTPARIPELTGSPSRGTTINRLDGALELPAAGWACPCWGCPPAAVPELAVPVIAD